MKYVKSVTLTVGLTDYRKRDLGPWLGYDDFLGRWLPVSQTQCEMLDHIASLNRQSIHLTVDEAEHMITLLQNAIQDHKEQNL